MPHEVDWRLYQRLPKVSVGGGLRKFSRICLDEARAQTNAGLETWTTELGCIAESCASGTDFHVGLRSTGPTSAICMPPQRRACVSRVQNRSVDLQLERCRLGAASRIRCVSIPSAVVIAYSAVADRTVSVELRQFGGRSGNRHGSSTRRHAFLVGPGGPAS